MNGQPNVLRNAITSASDQLDSLSWNLRVNEIHGIEGRGEWK
jgi:hypothetical protein